MFMEGLNLRVQFLEVHKMESLVHTSQSMPTVIFCIFHKHYSSATLISKYNINNLKIKERQHQYMIEFMLEDFVSSLTDDFLSSPSP